MDHIPNGDIPNGTHSLNGYGNGDLKVATNGKQPVYANGVHEHDPSLEELERQLPTVHDGQIPLGELVSRTAQAIYAELTELAET